jgi:hypothetical protein
MSDDGEISVVVPWCLSAFYYASWNDAYGKMLHVGYVDKTFHSQAEAIAYFNAHNAHLRPYTSVSERTDWDPHTKLAYVAVPHSPHGGQLLQPWS